MKNQLGDNCSQILSQMFLYPSSLNVLYKTVAPSMFSIYEKKRDKEYLF